VETIGDDICWMKIGEDGRLWAINPEAGFFGVAPGTSERTNPNAIRTLQRDAIFTNTALTDDGDVWWEGLTDEPPAHLIDWRGQDWEPGCGRPAAHPNARFTVAAGQDPAIAPEWEDPRGVPISAILFGGRRSTAVPLVTEAFDWDHGVFLGATMASETTAAAVGEVGRLRRDPFAMLPFCGYHMGDYFTHWLTFGRKADPERLPKIFYVNWFRRDASGRFLWPGFGDNIRVLSWIVDRLEGRGQARETPVGRVPEPGSLDTSGLDLDPAALAELLRVDEAEWRAELPDLAAHFARFGDHLPVELRIELEGLARRLGTEPPGIPST
jgi:phosphoenolpyruvate carboxykinase (GTP)